MIKNNKTTKQVRMRHFQRIKTAARKLRPRGGGRVFPWKRDRDTIRNPVDVTFESREGDDGGTTEQFEVTPVEEIHLGSFLDGACREYASNDRDVVPPSSLPNRRGRVRFGFAEQIADGKSNFSVRVVLKGATSAPPKPVEHDMTQSELDLIGVVVTDDRDGDDDSTVRSDLSNVSDTTQFLPPAAPIDGGPIRIYDEMDLDTDDEPYGLRRKLSIEVYENDVNYGEDDSLTLADMNVYTDMEKMDMMKENCVHCVAPSAAVLSATTCAAAAALALL